MPAAIDERTERTDKQAMPAAALDAWRELDARVAGVRARHRAKFLAAGVLQAAMPAMVTAGALAIQHQLAPRLAAALVGYGVLIGLAWLPLLAWVLGPVG